MCIRDSPYTAANDGWKVENDTAAASYRKGSKATFCFYGTAVQWIGQQEDCFGPAVLYPVSYTHLHL